ncbi:MAG: hypothetical protein OXG79_03115 [Chloroflexi bacterium]|nr:hypothetical protein [Chloroflexota bacterium]
MPKLCLASQRRRLRLAAAVLAIASIAALTVWPSAAALSCEGIALDDGCLFTITGGDTDDPNDGFAVTNADGVPLWDFVQARDLQAIGYPISQRWVNGPFTLQAFQKVILQWDPGQGRMNYYNTLDVLANRYPDVELPNVPPHQVLEADRGADFATITQNHLALLEQNAAIKARFLSEPDWLNLYGLPIRYEEREVNGNPQGLQMLRAQRTVFVIWNVPAPGVTVGRVNLQNVPDKVKRLSNVIIPDAAKAPVAQHDVAGLPRFTLPTTSPAPASAPGPVSTPASDREVLIRLYHATNGPNWRSNANWLSDAPLSEWDGVATDDSGRVTQLVLTSNRLAGVLPPELGQLSKLRVLSTQLNSLTGTVPPELGQLASLEALDLAINDLAGTIPPALGDLANLKWLGLTGNQITGPIPPELGRLSNLIHLGLEANRLTGAIPPELAQLSRLVWLALAGGNQFTGCIPDRLQDVEENDLARLGLPFCGASDETAEVETEAEDSAEVTVEEVVEVTVEGADSAEWRSFLPTVGDTVRTTLLGFKLTLVSVQRFEQLTQAQGSPVRPRNGLYLVVTFTFTNTKDSGNIVVSKENIFLYDPDYNSIPVDSEGVMALSGMATPASEGRPVVEVESVPSGETATFAVVFDLVPSLVDLAIEIEGISFAVPNP